MDNFALIPNIIGLFYFNLKKATNWPIQNVFFVAIYLDTIDYIEKGQISPENIKEYFKLAALGKCALGDYIKNHSSGINSYHNALEFLLNLTLQTMAEIFKIDMPEAAANDIVDNVVSNKKQIKLILNQSMIGKDYYTNIDDAIKIKVNEVLNNNKLTNLFRTFDYNIIDNKKIFNV